MDYIGWHGDVNQFRFSFFMDRDFYPFVLISTRNLLKLWAQIIFKTSDNLYIYRQNCRL